MDSFLCFDPQDIRLNHSTPTQDEFFFCKPLLLLSEICCNFGGIIILSFEIWVEEKNKKRIRHSAVEYKVHNNKTMFF